MTLSDAIIAATGGPTVNDGLRSFYLTYVGALPGAATAALDDLERAFLHSQMPGAPGSNNDLWVVYLRDDLGYSGSLMDMKTAWWNYLAATVNPLGPPVAVTQPTISRSGNVLTLVPAQWQGADTVRIRWQRNGAGINGTLNDLTYTLKPADAGKRIRVRIRAINQFGTTRVFSNVIEV